METHFDDLHGEDDRRDQGIWCIWLAGGGHAPPVQGLGVSRHHDSLNTNSPKRSAACVLLHRHTHRCYAYTHVSLSVSSFSLIHTET